MIELTLVRQKKERRNNFQMIDGGAEFCLSSMSMLLTVANDSTFGFLSKRRVSSSDSKRADNVNENTNKNCVVNLCRLVFMAEVERRPPLDFRSDVVKYLKEAAAEASVVVVVVIKPNQ